VSRLAAAWEEFRKSIGWTADLPDRAEKIKKQGEFLIWVLAAIGYGVKDASWASWWPWLQPWSPLLLAAVIWYVAWKASVAWYKTRGPTIWIGPIEFDENYNFFEFFLRNRGEGEVVAHPYATADFRDRHGKRIPLIDDQIELHCRGYYKGDKVRLFGNKDAVVALLQINTEKARAPKTAQLLLTTPAEKPNFALVPLGNFTPVKEQHKLYLTVRVDFFDAEDKEFLVSKAIRLAIIPNERLAECYRVRPARWLWG
jgi:hypothetical protein